MAQNQTDVLDLIGTGSLNEATVKARQNKVEVVAAKALASNTDAKAQTDVAQVDANSALQKEADLAQVALSTVISNQTLELEREVKGTRGTLDAFRATHERVLGEYEKVLSDSKGFSFFTNPIATIRNHVVMTQQKQQLNALTQAMDSSNAHIDDAYAMAAQKINAYKATVLNKTQAELNLKANEMRAGYTKADILLKAEKDKAALAIGANRQQQFKADDAQTKAENANNSAVMENNTNRYRWDVMNNHSGAPYTLAAAKQMEELRRLDTPEDARVWSLAASRSSIAGVEPRRDGETPAQYSARRIAKDISNLGSQDGPAAAAVISKATTTKYNPIITMAETLIASEEIPWDAEIAKLKLPVGTQPTQAQVKMIQENHKTAQALLPQRDRIVKAGNFITREMSEDFSRSNVIPAAFPGSAELMQNIGASEPVVKFFSSNLARIAIEATPAKTGDSKKDLVLALYQAMEHSKTEGNLIPANQIPSAIAAYISQAYMSDYGVSGKYASEYAGYTELLPDAAMSPKILSKDGKMNYASPIDIANIIARAGKDDARSKSMSDLGHVLSTGTPPPR